MKFSADLVKKLHDEAPNFVRRSKRIALDRRLANLRSHIRAQIEHELQGPVALLDEALKFSIAFERYLYTQQRSEAAAPFLLHIARVRGDLTAIRVLIFHGQESAALSLARVFVEDIELAMATAADPEFALSYMQAKENEDFWSKHIGYGKIYKRVELFLKMGRGTSKDSQILIDHHRALKNFLSEHVHPSIRSAFRSAFPISLESPGHVENLPLGALGEYLGPLCIYLADDVQALSATCITAIVRPNPPLALSGFKPNGEFDDMIAAAHVLQELTRNYSRKMFRSYQRKVKQWEKEFKNEHET